VVLATAKQIAGRHSGPPTLAVLPLSNMSGDPNLQYLADGTTENLIANLARSPQIKVVSRTTTDAYKGKAMDVRQIGRETGADFVLEGSIQKSGDTMRIVGQLIDASTGEHVWSERYDGQSKDVLALQDDVAARILAALAGDSGRIKKAEYDKAWGKDSGDLGEYDFYLRGHQAFMQVTPAGIEESIKIWSQGLEKYPTSALLKVKLAYGYFMRVLIGSSSDAAGDCEKAYNLGQEGLGKRDAGPLAIGVGHMLMAEVQLVCRRDYDKALSEYETTLRMMPNDWVAVAGLAYVPIAAGKPDMAIKELSRLTKQDPLADWGFAYLSWAYFAKGEYEKAIDAAKQASIPVPTMSIPMLIASYAQLGRMEEAKAATAELLKALPNASLKLIREIRAVRDQEVLEREIAALRKAGVPEG
jgi:TolB-like protein